MDKFVPIPVRFNKLDLNLLVALDVLLDERSITRAAHRLNLSQSATSGVLSRLREFFEDELLVLVGRTMVATALAERLAEPVRDILRQIESTVEIRADFEPSLSKRHFRVVASDYVTSVAVTALIRKLAREAPGITLDVLMPNEKVIERFERGDMDLVVLPDAFDGLTEYSSAILFAETYSCVICADNTLVGEELTLDQYCTMPHVATRFGDRATMFEDWFFKQEGLRRRIEVTSGQFNSLPELVVGTQRIATVQTRLAKLAAKSLPIRILTPPMDIPPLNMLVRWHSYLDNDPGHRWLRETFIAVAQDSAPA